MSGNLRSEIEDFLFYEASLLDAHDYATWLNLTTPSIRYWAPVRQDLEGGDDDQLGHGILAHFDDDALGLAVRVKRLTGDHVHSNAPLARLRHIVSNVRILDEQPDRVRVTSNFLCFKSRLDEEKLYCGRRNDTLQRSADGWKIDERCIIFDHSTITSLTVLF